jgi:hypothetical protein
MYRNPCGIVHIEDLLEQQHVIFLFCRFVLEPRNYFKDFFQGVVPEPTGATVSAT